MYHFRRQAEFSFTVYVVPVTDFSWGAHGASLLWESGVQSPWLRGKGPLPGGEAP